MASCRVVSKPMRLQSCRGMGICCVNQTRPAPARPRLARGSSGHHVAAPPLTTTPIKLILRRNYYLRSAALVSNGGSEQLFGMVYWYGNGCGGVAGVGGDQPGAGSGGALTLLHAQEAAGERARLPSHGGWPPGMVVLACCRSATGG